MICPGSGDDAPPKGDNTHNPFIDCDPSKGIDEDILNQWETWFAEMDKNNIVVYFFFYDDDASVWSLNDNGELCNEEKDFIHTLISRFKHHKNLIWCIAEEYQEMDADYSNPQPKQHAQKIIEAISEADEYNHVIAVHQLTGLDFDFANDKAVGQFAIQYKGTAEELHKGMAEAWEKSAGRYNLNMSEAAEHGTGITARKKNWACAMGGAYVMVLGMDIESTPVSELNDCGNLVKFFKSIDDLNKMAPHDELAYEETEYILANPGESYIAYSSIFSEKIGIKNMNSGVYSFRWYDIINDTVIEQKNVHVASGNNSWRKPPGITGREAVVYVRR